jgi:protein transport protein SEC24
VWVKTPAQKAKEYRTTTMKAVVPLATSNFYAVDCGNSNPRFMRASLNAVPVTKETLSQVGLPMGVILQPLATLKPQEGRVPLVDLNATQNLGPMRCVKCRGYMNPFAAFGDGGRQWTCNLCGNLNDVPPEYQCNLDAYGYRRDRLDRPELNRGSIEYEVPDKYVARPPVPQAVVFVVDVSKYGVECGMVQAAVHAIGAVLDEIESAAAVSAAHGHQLHGNTGQWGVAERRVGIVTYGAQVQFYNVSPSLDEPKMVVVPDVGDVFAPLPPSQWLVPPTASLVQLRALLAKLPELFGPTAGVNDGSSAAAAIPLGQAGQGAHGNALGSAMSAVSDAVKEMGAKIILFQSGLPDVGVGKLPNREVTRAYGTDKEAEMYLPPKEKEAGGAFYADMAAVMAEKHVSVELFAHARGGSSCDIAIMSQLCQGTGGAVHLFPNAPIGWDRMVSELRHCLSHAGNDSGFEGVLKVRCSSGLKCTVIYGNCTDVRKLQHCVGESATPHTDCSSTYGLLLEHTGTAKDKMVEGAEVTVQCALLYTSVAGKRLLRLHHLCLPVTSVLADVFRYSDLECAMALKLKAAARASLVQPLSTLHEAATNSCVDILSNYRRYCASASSSGQLILPESLKLMPLYNLSILKNAAFRINDAPNRQLAGSRVRADERAFLRLYIAASRSAPRQCQCSRRGRRERARTAAGLFGGAVVVAVPLPRRCASASAAASAAASASASASASACLSPRTNHVSNRAPVTPRR